MRKWLTLLLALVLAMGIAGCKKDLGGLLGSTDIGGEAATEETTEPAQTEKYIGLINGVDGNYVLCSNGEIEYSADDNCMLADGSAVVYQNDTAVFVQRPGNSTFLCELMDYDMHIGELIVQYQAGFVIAETVDGLMYYPDLELGEAIKIGDYQITGSAGERHISASADGSAAFIAKEDNQQVLYHVDLDALAVTEIYRMASSNEYGKGIALKDGISKDYVSYTVDYNNRYEWINPAAANPRKGQLYSYFDVPMDVDGEAFFRRADGTDFALPFVTSARGDGTYQVSRNEQYVAVMDQDVKVFELVGTEAISMGTFDVPYCDAIQVYDDGTVLVTDRDAAIGIIQNGAYTQIPGQYCVRPGRMDYCNGIVYFVAGEEDFGGQLMKYTVATGTTEQVCANAQGEVLATLEGCYYLAEPEQYAGAWYYGKLYFEGSDEPLKEKILTIEPGTTNT